MQPTTSSAATRRRSMPVFAGLVLIEAAGHEAGFQTTAWTVRASQEFPYNGYTYVTSDVEPDTKCAIAGELEFNAD